MDQTPNRLHFFLIAGTVMYLVTDAEGNAFPQSTQANAIVRHDDQNFPAYKIGKAQQNLLKSFAQKLTEEVKASLSIADIVVTTISHIGFMTEEEFQQEDPNMVAALEAEAKTAAVPETI